jgi:hypothetical protein
LIANQNGNDHLLPKTPSSNDIFFLRFFLSDPKPRPHPAIPIHGAGILPPSVEVEERAKGGVGAEL